MKYLLLALFLSPFLLNAQSIKPIQFYKDSSYIAPFQRLDNSKISVNNNLFWDDNDFTFPIGFKFYFFQDSTSNLYTSSLFGGGTELFTAPISFTSNNISLIISSFGDLLDRGDSATSLSKSPIAYSLQGVSPNRIYKIEWRNAGAFNGLPKDSIDLQVWLYEHKDIIEIHYGDNNISNPIDCFGGDGPGIAIISRVSAVTMAAQKVYNFNGSPAAPGFDSTNTNINNGLPFLYDVPASGRIYRFTPTQATQTPFNVENIALKNKCALMNNAEKLIFNAPLSGTFEITNLGGQLILNGLVLSGNTSLDISPLVSGVYLFKYNTGGDFVTKKFSK
jgi:hypothetical protein